MGPGPTQGFTLGYGLKVSPSGLLPKRMTWATSTVATCAMGINTKRERAGLLPKRMTGATSTVATCVMGIKNARKRMKNVPYLRNSAEPSTNPAD